MHVRLARDSDLPRLACIGVAAFASDLIYGHFHPLRCLYPYDFASSILNTLRRLMFTPGRLIVLAELSGEELMQGTGQTARLSRGKRNIVGYMTLVRHGTKESIAAWNPDSNEKRK